MNLKREYTIEFRGELPVKVLEGQSILKASLAAGIQHYHVCGGRGKCSTCRVLVYEGEEYLTSPTRRELALGQRMKFSSKVRLACQTRVLGEPVLMHRIMRDDADCTLYLGESIGDDTDKIGEERELALFFLDIRNFTPFMTSHLPFDVMHILRRMFKIFKIAIEENNGGKILETGGDSLYAVFGIDRDLKTAIADAVAAGLEILNDVEVFNERYLTAFFNYRIDVGIGLHAGKVIFGNRGLGLSSNLAAMGPPVNVAARLQNATKQLNNSFVVSDQVFELLDSKPTEAPAATVQLKGISKEQKVRLLGKPYQWLNLEHKKES
ncbi:adenylate/guanylate cyclase domain-containing protein [Cesiribacter sp. SM1]|uniref:adenylate/guanylate cyclase domain-containing protein n=1 Tax=Cesiribacter sp. SM1 TaxID=2861196 RepID=UPI001CD697E5|nr:adenylate/guanylate cyclase domain-containing protein [Cesiribacter sp. SM1]